MTEKIPQANPRAGFIAQKEQICSVIQQVLENGSYILGPEVEAFEREFAAFVGPGHAVAAASGTDALVLALRAAGVEKGDIVATVAHTAVATVAAVELAGGEPLLLDVDDSYGMDPVQLEQVLATELGRRIKVVIPVHLYGQMVDPAIFDMAAWHGITVIEDCAQAHGASLDGRRAGSCGLLSAFSFYPTKNLGALGDAGAIVTDAPELAERLRELRQYGWRQRAISVSAGMNSRMDEIQAAILRVKLERLEQDNEERRMIADIYDAGLADCGVDIPRRRRGARPVFHQYVICCDQRNRLREGLAAKGVGTSIHYSVPVHLQPAYAGRVRLADKGLPQTENLAGRIVSLPIYPQMTREIAERVAESVRETAAALP